MRSKLADDNSIYETYPAIWATWNVVRLGRRLQFCWQAKDGLLVNL